MSVMEKKNFKRPACSLHHTYIRYKIHSREKKGAGIGAAREVGESERAQATAAFFASGGGS